MIRLLLAIFWLGLVSVITDQASGLWKFVAWAVWIWQAAFVISLLYNLEHQDNPQAAGLDLLDRTFEDLPLEDQPELKDPRVWKW